MVEATPNQMVKEWDTYNSDTSKYFNVLSFKALDDTKGVCTVYIYVIDYMVILFTW